MACARPANVAQSGRTRINIRSQGGNPVRQTQERYDIRIRRDGVWVHEGGPIRRMELVKLFAGALRRDEAGDYWLETPAERGRIVVEDAPFIAVEMAAAGEGRAQVLRFRTNVDDWVTAGADHPLTLAPDAPSDPANPDSPPALVPYIMVRGGLTARLNRAVYYELAGLAGADDPDGRGRLGVWSDGVFFPLQHDAQDADPA